MGRRKKQVETANFDNLVFLGGGIYPETRVSISEVLQGGTAEERRAAVFTIARHLESGTTLPDAWREWIVQALKDIAAGADANRALGLTTKRKWSIQHLKNLRYLVADLRSQGVPYHEALDIVAQYDPITKEFKSIDRGDALHKLLQRRRPRK